MTRASVRALTGAFPIMRARVSIPICCSCFLSSTLTRKPISSTSCAFEQIYASAELESPGRFGLNAEPARLRVSYALVSKIARTRRVSTPWRTCQYACCKYLIICSAKGTGLLCVIMLLQHSMTMSRTTCLLSLIFSMRLLRSD